ncbi:MAG: tetratricopeptide repeat protein [Polaromonas sp.]|jgi:predicted negative regulator of RcsB-dependent stress response|nr:tetratricopeptide repeat protein [Polaromonas sp.]MBP8087880.1 tetratricopeptide repeat protein [Polaromonas sp.]
MANHLDLEEQEQLAELKHFWSRYGNIISWVLIVVFGAVASWNGYQYWQRSQAAQAAVMYDEVERAAVAGDVAKLERALGDMKERFGRTAYAEQAALLAARIYHDKGNLDAAKGALAWVAGKASDDGYQAVARLRLSGMLFEAKAYDEALQQLVAPMPSDFNALAADRRGDILLAQGKKAEAKAQYEAAYKGLDERSDYRRIIEVKLNALGVDPVVKVAAPAAAASEAAK